MQTPHSSALSLLAPATPAPSRGAALAASAGNDDSPAPAFSSVLTSMLPAEAAATSAATAATALPLTGRLLPLAGSIQQQTQIGTLGDETALPSINTLLSQIGAGQAGSLLTSEPANDETAAALLTAEEAAQLAAENGAVVAFMVPGSPAEVASRIGANGADDASTGARPAPAGLTSAIPAADAESAEPADDSNLLNTTALTSSADSDSGQMADEAVRTSLLTPQNNAAASTPTTATSVAAAAVAAETSISTAATVAAQKNAATSLPDELSQALREERLNFGNDRSTWGGALGARVVAMVMDDVQQARIHLDPPELGSLEIRLQVQQDQATVQVQVQNGQVRDALEAGAQRLRDALAGQGLQLAGYDVSERGQQSQAQQGQSGQGGQGDRSADGAEGEWLATDDSQSLAPAGSLNLLDTYA